MPSEGNEFFTPNRRQREEEFLEQRLQNMESALIRLHSQRLAIVDPQTGLVVAPGGESLGQQEQDGGGDTSIAAHELLNDAYHVDTVTGTPVQGDVVIANAANLWTRLAAGTTGYFLKMVAGLPAWALAALGVKKAGTLVGTRENINFIEGAGLTITVTDNAPNVDVTIAASGGGAATFTTQENNVTVEASTDTLNFGLGFDVTNPSAGKASVVPNLSEVVTGDVAYASNVGTVEAIQGTAVDALPASSPTTYGLVPYFDASDNIGWDWQDIPITGWSRGSISGISTSATPMVRVGGGAGIDIPAPFVATRFGTVVGISWATDDGGSVGTGTYEVALAKNGSVTAYAASATGTNKAHTRGASPIIQFAAGDELELWDKRTGTLAAKGIQATLFVAWFN